MITGRMYNAEYNSPFDIKTKKWPMKITILAELTRKEEVIVMEWCRQGKLLKILEDAKN